MATIQAAAVDAPWAKIWQLTIASPCSRLEKMELLIRQYHRHRLLRHLLALSIFLHSSAIATTAAATDEANKNGAATVDRSASENFEVVVDFESRSPEGSCYADNRTKTISPQGLEALRAAIIASQTKTAPNLEDFGITEQSVIANREVLLNAAYTNFMGKSRPHPTFDKLSPEIQKLFDYETVSKNALSVITGSPDSAYECAHILIPGNPPIVLVTHHIRGGYLPWRVVMGDKTWKTYSRDINKLLADHIDNKVFSFDRPSWRITMVGPKKPNAYWPDGFYMQYGQFSSDQVESADDIEAAKKLPGWVKAAQVVALEDARVYNGGSIGIQIRLLDNKAPVDKVRWTADQHSKQAFDLHDWNDFLVWLALMEKDAASTQWLAKWRLAEEGRSAVAMRERSDKFALETAIEKRKEWDAEGIPKEATYKLQLWKNGLHSSDAFLAPPFENTLLADLGHGGGPTARLPKLMQSSPSTPLRTHENGEDSLSMRITAIINRAGKTIPADLGNRGYALTRVWAAPKAEDKQYDYSWPVDFSAEEDLEYLFQRYGDDKYESANFFSDDDKLLWGAISKDGTMILPSRYYWIGAFSDGLASVKNIDEKAGFVDQKGALVIPAQFDKVGDFHEGLAPVCKGDKWGFVDTKGNIAIPLIYDSVKRFSGGLAPARLGTKCGYIDKDGHTRIPFEFARARHFVNGLAYVQKNRKRAYIDRTGKPIGGADNWYDTLERFAEDHAEFGISNSDSMKYGFIDRAGNQVIPAQYTRVSAFRNGMAQVAIGDEHKAIDFNNQVIHDKSGSHSDFWDGPLNGGPIRAQGPGYSNWGFKDSHTGKFVIQPKYESTGVFADGFCPVRMKDKWGLIDEKGNLVVNCQYDEMQQLITEHLLAVKTGDFWGVIDTSGKAILPPTYSAISPFNSGIAVVQKGSKFGYINADGKELIKPKFDAAQPFDNSGIARVAMRATPPQKVTLP